MWYIFPQVVGLGFTSMAQRYSIHSLDEAKAYLAHPVLGARLKEATKAILDGPESDMQELLGEVDALKFRSSMTLFALASRDGEDECFEVALEKLCDGEMDDKTVEILEPSDPSDPADEIVKSQDEEEEWNGFSD